MLFRHADSTNRTVDKIEMGLEPDGERAILTGRERRADLATSRLAGEETVPFPAFPRGESS